MIGRAVSVLLALGTSACQDPALERHDLVEPCDELCIADPSPHCIAVEPSCNTGGQCASGLTCAVIDPRNPCYSKDDQARQCRPASFDRLALQVAYGVGGMPISVLHTPSVSWQPPSDAEAIACALFSCAPSFKTTGSSPTGKHEIKTIDNFGQCVLLFGAFPAGQSEFLLINENIYRDPARCDDSTTGQRVITELAAGCWAYDSASLIAASELRHVSGALLPDLSVIPHDKACVADGDACYDAATDRFGVCLDNACASRCMTDADCMSSSGAASGGDRCTWSCHELPGQALGACVRSM